MLLMQGQVQEANNELKTMKDKFKNDHHAMAKVSRPRCAVDYSKLIILNPKSYIENDIFASLEFEIKILEIIRNINSLRILQLSSPSV